MAGDGAILLSLVEPKLSRYKLREKRSSAYVQIKLAGDCCGGTPGIIKLPEGKDSTNDAASWRAPR